MPFEPFPEMFAGDLERLVRRDGTCGLDLGCGDSDLARRLTDAGLPVWGLDRSPDGAVSVIADAMRLPVADKGVDLLLAANLARHLLRGRPDGGFLAHWFGALRPGGVLYVLEDEPDLSTPARRNYHDLQAFLAVLCGPGRGPLVPLRKVRPLAERALPGADVRGGRLANRRRADVRAVLDMLRRGEGGDRGEAGRLRRLIARHGLDYGPYWWLRAMKPEG